MRTVTFADEKVVDAINDGFIPVWHNQSVESVQNRPSTPAGAQPAYTAEELELYPEGSGGTNVLSYVCSTEGKVLHLLTGWWRTERFLDEMTFARELPAIAADRDALVKAHRRHKERHAAETENLARAHPEEMKKPFRDSKIRRLHAALNLQGIAHEYSIQNIHQILGEILKQLEIQHASRGEIG